MTRGDVLRTVFVLVLMLGLVGVACARSQSFTEDAYQVNHQETVGAVTVSLESISSRPGYQVERKTEGNILGREGLEEVDHVRAGGIFRNESDRPIRIYTGHPQSGAPNSLTFFSGDGVDSRAGSLSVGNERRATFPESGGPGYFTVPARAEVPFILRVDGPLEAEVSRVTLRLEHIKYEDGEESWHVEMANLQLPQPESRDFDPWG
ncbi:MAG: hypothetical protein WD208_04535 [Dehalococcoidia bacterium]